MELLDEVETSEAWGAWGGGEEGEEEEVLADWEGQASEAEDIYDDAVHDWSHVRDAIYDSSYVRHNWFTQQLLEYGEEADGGREAASNLGAASGHNGTGGATLVIDGGLQRGRPLARRPLCDGSRSGSERQGRVRSWELGDMPAAATVSLTAPPTDPPPRRDSKFKAKVHHKVHGLSDAPKDARTWRTESCPVPVRAMGPGGVESGGRRDGEADEAKMQVRRRHGKIVYAFSTCG
jgi:hypothetical protein